MNILFKIAIVTVVYVISASVIKTHRPEYVFLLRLVAVFIIIFYSIDYLTEFISSCLALLSSFEIDSLHISLLIKIIGVAILTDIISDNLKDNGEIALSNTVILVSKFIILYMTLPIFNGIIIFCLKFIDL